eukprot:3788855-Pleurochrysis_carterae.AAC.3
MGCCGGSLFSLLLSSKCRRAQGRARAQREDSPTQRSPDPGTGRVALRALRQVGVDRATQFSIADNA